jgi:hypothetical protein
MLYSLNKFSWTIKTQFDRSQILFCPVRRLINECSVECNAKQNRKKPKKEKGNGTADVIKPSERNDKMENYIVWTWTKHSSLK